MAFELWLFFLLSKLYTKLKKSGFLIPPPPFVFEHRQECFGSPFFNACIEALQLHEEMDKYNEWRDTLGRK